MMLELKILAVVVAVVVIATAVYLVLVAMEAKAETKNAPREDMVECHTGRHGPYPKRSALMISDLGTEKPIAICPICYQESVAKAKASLKGKQ